MWTKQPLLYHNNNNNSPLFQVFINQKHYIDFAHRIDADRICHLMMTGACNFFEPEYY